jgi:Domain of unknown function (DUF4177)
MIFEYKCVAGPTIVAVRHARVRDQAVKAFEDIMNAEAAEGWEYVGIDEFHVSEPQGFFTRKRVYVPSKILVFRRAKVGSAVVEALKAQAIKHEAPKLSVVPDLVELRPEDIEKAPSMKAITEKVKSIKS